MVDDEEEREASLNCQTSPLFKKRNFMNSVNFNIADRFVNLIFHDDGHDGPAFRVIAIKNRSKGIPFARFKHFKDAVAYRNKYAAYYPFVKFYVYRTLF